MAVQVYFEYKKSYAEIAATFDSEETYLACLPALELLAENHNFTRCTEVLFDIQLIDLYDVEQMLSVVEDMAELVETNLVTKEVSDDAWKISLAQVLKVIQKIKGAL